MRSPPRSYQHDHGTFRAGTMVKLDFFAFQGDSLKSYGRSPWRGAQSGDVEVGASICKKIQFETDGFTKGSQPMVIGTLIDGTAEVGAPRADAPMHWVENIDATKFMVCFKFAPTVEAAPAPNFKYEWMAFEHKNPWLWFRNHSPYSAAGTVAAGSWTKHDYQDTVSSGLGAEEGLDVFKTCKSVPFPKVYNQVPIVLVTANHRDRNNLDWQSYTKPPFTSTSTYVELVTKTHFSVCSAETPSTAGAAFNEDALSWDWVSFNEDTDVGGEAAVGAV